MDADVVVIGAGISGLITARDLQRAGFDVQVIEAADRVGGKTHTINLDGDHVDLGAHWVGPGHDRTYQLARDLGVAVKPHPARGAGVLVLDGRRYVYRAGIPLLPPRLAFDLITGVAKLWWRCRTAAPLSAEPSTDLATMSASELAQRLFRTAAARSVLNMFTGLLLGADNSEVSAAHLLTYMQVNGGPAYLSEFTGGAQQDFFAGGAQQLSEKLAASLSRPVETGTTITAIEQDSDAVTVHSENRSWRARRAVVALGPTLLRRINFTPALPDPLTQYCDRAQMGSYSKYIAVYDTPWWQAEGLSGNAFSADGPLQMVVDGGADSGRGILVGFATGDSARNLAALPEADRRQTALRAMAHMIGARALDPIEFQHVEWAANPVLAGAPVAFPPPGTAPGPDLFPPAPFGLTHWAGTDFAVKWNGYLEGAVLSGERAAREVAQALSDYLRS